MQEEEIVRQSWSLLEPELARQGFELIEVEYLRSGGSWVLRLYIDREGGITIDHCAEASRSVSAVLDLADYIDDRYGLEMSSPGIDRPVRKPDDFQKYRGERVKLQTVSPIEGRRRYTGTLMGFEDGLITVEVDGTNHEIHIENLKKANLDR